MTQHPKTIFVRYPKSEDSLWEYEDVAYVLHSEVSQYEKEIKQHQYNLFEEGQKEKMVSEIASLREALDKYRKRVVQLEKTNG